MRPEFITNEDIDRWDDNLNNDTTLPKGVAQALQSNPLLKEAMYAGLWLGEELKKIGCAPEKIVVLQFTAGHSSFGRDIWQVHQELLEDYNQERIEWADEFDA